MTVKGTICTLLASCQMLSASCNINNTPTTAGDAGGPVVNGHPPLILAGLQNIGTMSEVHPDLPAGIDEEMFEVHLEDGTPRAQLESWPGKFAMLNAAGYYAAFTEDYQVTVREIVESGFWPYDYLPVGSLDATVYDPDHFFKVQLTASELAQRDTGGYLLGAKRHILKQLISDYYSREKSPVPADQLSRVAKFWINPLTGSTMSESSEIGDYTLYRLDSLPYSIQPAFRGIDASWEVPIINIVSSAPQANFLSLAKT